MEWNEMVRKYMSLYNVCALLYFEILSTTLQRNITSQKTLLKFPIHSITGQLEKEKSSRLLTE